TRIVTSGNPAEAIIPLAGAQASEGMLVQNYWVPYAPAPGQEEASKKFQEAYESQYKNRAADKYAVSGYDAVKLVAAAVEKAGSDDPAKIRDAVKTIKMPALQGVIEFDAQGQARPYQSMSRNEAGKPVILLKVAQ